MEGSENDGGVSPIAKWKSDFSRTFQYFLDRSTPHTIERWLGTLAVGIIYVLRVYYVQGFYVISYGLGIYVLNLLIGFLSPKVDPELEALDGASLPTKGSDEFKPFIRRLPEFKFWSRTATSEVTGEDSSELRRPFSTTKVCHHKGFCSCICIDFLIHVGCTCFLANIVMLLDFSLFPDDETPNSAHDQIQICALRYRKTEVYQ